MPIQIDHGIKGKEYPPYAVTVERGKIKEFARAIGDESPFYLDDEVGRASPWGDIIAPPTFPVTFRSDRAGTETLLHDLGVDIGRILHGEQEFEHFKPILPGPHHRHLREDGQVRAHGLRGARDHHHRRRQRHRVRDARHHGGAVVVRAETWPATRRGGTW